MHPIDDAILFGTLTPDALAAHTARPLPPPGYSYWADHMRAGHPAAVAVRLAARDMGASLASLRAVGVL